MGVLIKPKHQYCRYCVYGVYVQENLGWCDCKECYSYFNKNTIRDKCSYFEFYDVDVFNTEHRYKPRKEKEVDKLQIHLDI